MMKLFDIAKTTLYNTVSTLLSWEKLKKFISVSLYRNALFLMLNSGSMAVSSFLFWIIAARIYDDETVGLMSAIISAVTILTILASLGINYSIVRFISHDKENTTALLNSCFTIGVLTSIVVTIIFIAGIGFWSPQLSFLQQEPVISIIFLVYTVMNTLFFLVNHTFIAKRRTGFVLIANTIFGWLRIPMLFVLVIVSRTSGIIFAISIALLFSVIIELFFFLPRIQPGYRVYPAIKTQTLRSMTRFSLTNYIASILENIPGLIYPLIIVNIAGAEANAYFYIAWMAATILNWISIATSSSLFAEGSHDNTKLFHNTRQSIKLIALLLVPTLLVFLILGDKLLSVFGASYSESGAGLLRILAIAVLPASINRIYFSIKRVQQKMGIVITLNAAITIMALVLGLFLLPSFDIIGIGYAWLISQGVVSVIVVALFTLKR